jgi:hypothetical protein
MRVGQVVGEGGVRRRGAAGQKLGCTGKSTTQAWLACAAWALRSSLRSPATRLLCAALLSRLGLCCCAGARAALACDTHTPCTRALPRCTMHFCKYACTVLAQTLQVPSHAAPRCAPHFTAPRRAVQARRQRCARSASRPSAPRAPRGAALTWPGSTRSCRTWWGAGGI